MAKKKNAVKSALNPLRQALLAVKTATLNFSPEHILSLSYDPSSKAMTVKDIPANLESQFTLGESGGGSAPTPVLTQKIIIKNSYEGTVYLSNYDYIIDGKYVQKDEEQLSPGEYNVVIPIVKSKYQADVFSFYPLAMNHDTSDYGTVTDLVNCEADTIYGSDSYLVIDPSQDVSITTTFE